MGQTGIHCLLTGSSSRRTLLRRRIYLTVHRRTSGCGKCETRNRCCLLLRGSASRRTFPCSFAIDERINAGGIEYDSLHFNNYSGYTGYSGAGCTALTVSFAGDSYDYWNALRKSGGYDEQKRLLADELSRIVEKHLPRAAEKIEVVNIATPLTYERYTGSHRGAWMTFMDKTSRPAMPAPVSKDINNLYFAGFRTIVPGGLPVALYSGFRAAQYACRDNGIVFEGG